MQMVANQSMAYCTERPARMISVMCENTIVILLFSYPSANMVRHRIKPVPNITASSLL